MYKMVVIDLDGTLLNDKKQVSTKNAQIINQIYQEKGVIFVIATGKNQNDITQVIQAVGNSINEYVITSNGAIIKDNINNNYLLKNYINKEQVIEIIDIYKKQNLRGIIHTGSYTLTDEEKEAQTNQNIKLVQDLKSVILEDNTLMIPMLTVSGDEKNLRKMTEELKAKFSELDATAICHFVVDTGEEIYETKYIDIMKKNATKANAIKKLADYLHINKEKIIVIGDGLNDISMFEMSGYKIAMGNADEDLKKRADYVTDSNNEDGVAKALKYIFYEREKI